MTSMNSSVLAGLMVEAVTHFKLQVANDVGTSALRGILGIRSIGWFFSLIFCFLSHSWASSGQVTGMW